MSDEKSAPPGLNELLPAARNFSLTLAERVRGQEGVPAHIRRKREIEDRIDALLRVLRERRGRGATLHELRLAAAKLDLERLNDLIEKHNKYYPIEANLPIDPRSGGSLDGGRPFSQLDLVTPEALIQAL